MALRRGLTILLAITGMGSAGVACADHAPSIVVPGRPDVPVIINGRDARGGIAIGDWGLYRPGTPVTVIYRQPWPKLKRNEPAQPVRRYRRKRAAKPSCKCEKPVAAPQAAPREKEIPPGERHFYPGGSTPPRFGRLEDDRPMSPPPKPAESFSRSWSTSSQPAPATINQTPVVVAPTVVEPQVRPRRLRPPRPPQPPRRARP
jgi:hypothetical protein